MDIEELQRVLREFAAQRNWQPFHTPKNLAMALMVEAAELVEIFQWMTPEESREVHANHPTRQRIGEELADVLLYLLQVADHTGTDLRHAVTDKLARNAQKYPPAHEVEREARAAAAEAVTHVLLDYENVQPTEAELRELVPDATRVWVFHGPHQKQVDQKFSSYGRGMTAVPISKTGKNALDFHLSFYMGYIASRNQDARLVVVANDTGYAPMLEHAKALGFPVRQLGYARMVAPLKVLAPKPPAVAATPLSTVPLEKAVAKKVAAKKAPAVKAAATKKPPAKTPAKKVPAKKVAAKKAAKPKAPAKRTGTSTAKPVLLPVEKIADSLRKMGTKRPVKVATLKRALKSYLGEAATGADVEAVLTALRRSGVVVAGSEGRATYPLFQQT